MHKPVSILALDEASAKLAGAVQRRVAAACGLDDLVQWRGVDGELAAVIASIHARRQAPDSPLRLRDDVGKREVVLLIASAAGTADVLETARAVRSLYEMRRFAAFYSIEILCLLPDLFASATTADYGAAYALLRTLSGIEPKPFDEVWLLDAMNQNRVKFGPLESANETYAEAVAGALLYEPELSGAMAAHHPRGVHPTFSTFGYAELVFPREIALQRLQSRFASELTARVLLKANEQQTPAALRAKQFVVGEEFAAPMTRIGADGGQSLSLFARFQAKTLYSERTRSADELIAAVRNELQTHRDKVHLGNLERLARQGEETALAHAALLARTVDETLDRDGYPSGIALTEALVDPLPDLHAEAPRNLVTELNAAASALDKRLAFQPNSANSDATRKRIRELEQLLDAQTLVAATLNPVSAAEQLAELEREKAALTRRLPEILFSEEAENNAARNAAIDAESQRLADETRSREDQLRELFAQKPRFEEALAEALEAGRDYVQKHLLWAAIGAVALAGICFKTDLPYLSIPIGLAIFALYAVLRYFSEVAPRIRAAREALERLVAQIEATDRAKNGAHDDELQFEFDVARRRTILGVLRRAREAAAVTLEALRTRCRELQELRFEPSTIVPGALAIPILEDADVDAWYERTEEDRQPLVREFPITRAQSRHLAMDELRERLTAYSATAFEGFRGFTLAQAARLTDDAALAQRLKRFAEYSAPLIELSEDLEAEKLMQKDRTLWLDASDATFVTQLQRRLTDAHVRPAPDPLRVTAVSRFLHYPGYVLGQIEYYRAQYDEARHPQSALLADLTPPELAFAPPVRAAYEQVLLGRAVGAVTLRDGETNLARAQQIVAAEEQRRALTSEIARLSIARNVEEDLRGLLDERLTPFERTVVTSLLDQQRLR